MTERKMVTIRKVLDVLPIEGADKIELIKIDGWQVVSGKGNFKPGDFAVFHEIDSFVDTSLPQYKFLEKNNIVWRGKQGARIKTIRLRGQLSQGLALPISDFPKIVAVWNTLGASNVSDDELVATLERDWSDVLGVQKWEREPDGSGNSFGRMYTKGNFPYFLQKTDQERIQNLFNYIDRNVKYEVSQKMDGSSMTIYWRDKEFGVCSRNFDLKEDENSFWQVVKNQNIKEKVSNLVQNIAFQGELVGPGVNGNRHNLSELDYYVFNVFDIDSQTYLNPLKAMNICEVIGLKYVPVFEYKTFDFNTIEDALSFAETIQNGEGIVFKQLRDHCVLSTGKKEAPVSFKIISNKYLMDHDD